MADRFDEMAREMLKATVLRPEENGDGNVTCWDDLWDDEREKYVRVSDEQWRQAMAKPVSELPDDLRVPLHSLQADLDLFVARIAQEDDEVRGLIKDAMRNHLSQVETASYRLNAQVNDARTALAERDREVERLKVDNDYLGEQMRAIATEAVEQREAAEARVRVLREAAGQAHTFIVNYCNRNTDAIKAKLVAALSDTTKEEPRG